MSRLVSYFIAFHDAYYPENTREFTMEEIGRLFIWYSVARSTIQSEAKVPVLLRERFLPVYDAGRMQEEHWYQNSMLFHLWRNPSVIEASEYVGFGQYDFGLSKEGFDLCTDILKDTTSDVGSAERGSADVCIGMLPYSLDTLWEVVSREAWDTMFTSRYNDRREQNHSLIFGLWHQPFLCHAFIIPTWFFMEMMEFMELVLPELKELAGGERHLAGTIERALAIYLNFAFAEGRLRRCVVRHAIRHNDHQRLADPFRGILATPGKDAQELQDGHSERSV